MPQPDQTLGFAAKQLAKRVLPKRVVAAARHRMPEPVRQRLRTKVGGTAPAAACPLPRAFLNRDDKGRVPDFCYPLDDPQWVSPDEATLMLDDDVVLGFVTSGPSGEQAWSIPWWVMKNHHVANLTLDGTPYLVTLCEACAGGGVYDPVVEGRRLRFRVEGVYDGLPFIIDDGFGSLWSMIDAKPLHGRAVSGGPLPWSPYVNEPWVVWRERYPETRVAHGVGEPRDGHGSAHLSPVHDDEEAFYFPDDPDIGAEDDRLPRISLVVGVEMGDARVAYPLDRLHDAGGVLNVDVADRPVAVVSKPGSFFAIVFDRRVRGRTIELGWTAGTDAESSSPTLTDEVTGSTWDLWGMCIAGELTGEHLAAVHGGVHKWFGWVRSGPATEVWPG